MQGFLVRFLVSYQPQIKQMFVRENMIQNFLKFLAFSFLAIVAFVVYYHHQVLINQQRREDTRSLADLSAMDFEKAIDEYKKLLAMKAAMELDLPSFEKAVKNFKESASKDLLNKLYQFNPEDDNKIAPTEVEHSKEDLSVENSDPEPPEPKVDILDSIREMKKSDSKVEKMNTEAMPIIPLLPPKEDANQMIEQSVIEQTDTKSPRRLKSMQLQPIPENTIGEKCKYQFSTIFFRGEGNCSLF